MFTHPEKSRSSSCCFKLNAKDTGASLIEVLVSIVILIVALTPAVYLSISILGISSNIRDNLVAANLAQEGIEVVRGLRDANWFSGLAFDNGLIPPFFDCTVSCRIEWGSTGLMALAGNPPLLKNINGVYNYGSGTPTIFRRTLTITSVSTWHISVQSTVTWDVRGRTKSVVAEEHLYNWR